MLGLFERAMETSPDVTDDCLASEDALNVSLSQASPLDHRESLLYYASTTLQRRGRKPTDVVTSFRSDQDSLFGTSFGLQKCFLEKTRGFKEKLWVSGTCKGLDQGETFLSRQQNDRWISFKQASVSGYLLQLPTGLYFQMFGQMLLSRNMQSHTWNSILLIYTNTEKINAMPWVDVDCLTYQFGCEKLFTTVCSLMLAGLSIKS